MQHPRSLDFATQRRVVLLREVGGLSFASIADTVHNIQGQPPTKDTVRRVYHAFSAAKGRVTYRYHKSGRKPFKVTKEVRKTLEKILLKLRRQGACAADALRRELLREHGVRLASSTVRKELHKLGYFWLPKCQKRLYSKADKQARLNFAQDVVAMTPAQLREKMAFAMDGVVLSMPPEDATERANFCKQGDTHMWRKRGEAFSARLAGGESYAKQVPLARALPLWGGLSEGGFAPVLFHDRKKLTAEEWAAAVDDGALENAIKSVKPRRPRGPWHVICDNESFLTSPECRRAHRHAKVTLWKIPPRSPDLNPIERFWAWLRKALRARDQADLAAKRPPLSKAAFKARVQAVCKTKRAQKVAKNFAKMFRKVCEEVVAQRGAASKY